jgi:hypothetical protein
MLALAFLTRQATCFILAMLKILAGFVVFKNTQSGRFSQTHLVWLENNKRGFTVLEAYCTPPVTNKTV